MSDETTYDVAIVGGGLAGLSCAILLAQRNYKVILFEKERYPFHKVCGEYISLESYDFLESLGIKLTEKNVPLITRLTVSSPSGIALEHPLPLGGFGLSRFVLDNELVKIAAAAGVVVIEGMRVNEIAATDNQFEINTDVKVFHSRLLCAAYGKRSNLDIKWKRPFVRKKPNALNNFIGVKYHAILDRPRDLIELHNFKDGYCGISPIESGLSCICYLTSAQNLRQSNNVVSTLERQILYKNLHLKNIFNNAQILYEKPLIISQISFDRKSQFENGIIFLGDAASMIAPLCGNGMSMALHSSRLAAEHLGLCLEGKLSRKQMGTAYTEAWHSAFSRRLAAGRIIQSMFGSEWLTNAAILALRKFPGLLSSLIRQTHGSSKI